jgi:hypothetical protein
VGAKQAKETIYPRPNQKIFFKLDCNGSPKALQGV